jgi:hypothetical protein
METNPIDNLRFDVDGKAYFFHYSKADLKVGEKILPSGSPGLRQSNTVDALFGRSYAYDALDPRTIESMIGGQAQEVTLAKGTPEESIVRRFYLTSAPIENVGADINVMRAEHEDGGLNRLGRNNFRAVLGSQEIVDRVEIPFDNSTEENLKKSTSLVEDLLKKHGIIQNTAEEQRLVNIAHTISSRTLQDAFEYNDLRIKTRINDLISYDYFDTARMQQTVKDNPSIQPFVDAVKEKDIDKAFSLRHHTRGLLDEISGETLIEPKKVEAVLSIYEEFEESTGSKIGKKLSSYGRTEMESASRTLSRRTLDGIIQAGETAAEVMRYAPKFV